MIKYEVYGLFDKDYLLFRGNKLKGRCLTHGNFISRDYRGADFRGACLEYSDFTDSDLRGADLRGCSLYDVVFDKADLRGADFRGASIDLDTSFKGANVEGATFDYIKKSGVAYGY